MAKYIVKRVIMALITILVVACVTFVLMMSVPGSPFNDEKITPEQKAAMEFLKFIMQPEWPSTGWMTPLGFRCCATSRESSWTRTSVSP